MKLQLDSLFRFFRPARKNYKSSDVIKFSSEKVRQMNEYMELQQPFLKVGYDIRSLASELNIPSYQLSAYLNRKMGINFNDYLNQYRVNYGKELIRKGLADSFNLKGLSKKCGFNNRNTFTTAFKKFTGHTPSDFAKNYQLYQ